MHKKLFTFVCLVTLCLPIFAQQNDCYEMTKVGESIRYANYSGKILVGYVEKTVTDVKEENGAKIVSYRWDLLNKKGKPAKYARMAGMDKGILTSVKFEDGSYYLTFDLSYGSTIGERSGYLLKIPQTLQIGEELEGGTLKVSNKATGMSYNNEITFENWKVVEEVDLNTVAGTVRCMKIEGRVVGNQANQKFDCTGTIYLAKNIGIVRQETPSLSSKVEASQINLGVNP